MAKEITTEIEVNATAEKIWCILTNFEKYPEWNPFITSISGELKAGKKITARIEPPGAKAMTFKPTILVNERNKELRWIGRLLLPGIFDGEHKFELIDKENGSVIFRQSEKFKGILVPFLKKMLDVNTKNGFELMNRKLKELAELK